MLRLRTAKLSLDAYASNFVFNYTFNLGRFELRPDTTYSL